MQCSAVNCNAAKFSSVQCSAFQCPPGMGEFLPSNWLMELIADYVCGEDDLLEIVCQNVIFLLTGYDE